MARKHRVQNNSKRRGNGPPPELRGLRRHELVERVSPTVYGKPFIVLEDEAKNTFVFEGGAWIPHSATISECRATCQVKELPQRVNRMIRYEIRAPISSGT